MINSNLSNKGYSQRQLRVGELVKQSIGEIFIKNETKISSLNSRYCNTSLNDGKRRKFIDTYRISTIHKPFCSIFQREFNENRLKSQF